MATEHSPRTFLLFLPSPFDGCSYVAGAVLFKVGKNYFYECGVYSPFLHIKNLCARWEC